MSRKTPKHVIEMMERQQDLMLHVDEMIAVKALHPENQASWARNSTAEYYIGLADGANSMLENALHIAKCYNGFQYQAKTPTILPDGSGYYIETISTKHPEYQGWRRIYMVKG